MFSCLPISQLSNNRICVHISACMWTVLAQKNFGNLGQQVRGMEPQEVSSAEERSRGNIRRVRRGSPGLLASGETSPTGGDGES